LTGDITQSNSQENVARVPEGTLALYLVNTDLVTFDLSNVSVQPRSTGV